MINEFQGRRVAVVLLILALQLLSGCSKSAPSAENNSEQALSAARALVPEFYGFYALDSGSLSEIKFGAARLNLSSKARFIGFDKRFLHSAKINLYNREPVVGKVDPSNIGTWEQMPIECRTKPIDQNAEMIQIVPSHDLKPGLYELEYAASSFFVRREEFERNLQGLLEAELKKTGPFEPQWSLVAHYAAALYALNSNDFERLEYLQSVPSLAIADAERALSSGDLERATFVVRGEIPSMKHIGALKDPLSEIASRAQNIENSARQKAIKGKP